MNVLSFLRVAALCLAVLVAGCAEPGDSTPPSSTTDPDSEGVEPNPNATVRFHGNFSVEVFVLDEVGDQMDAANCLAVISDEDQVVSNVTAIATWETPFVSRLDMTYIEGAHFQTTETGTSPLEVQMNDSKLLEARSLFDISIEPSPGNTAPRTTVDVYLTFEHEQGQEVEIWPGSCDVAGPLFLH